MPEPGRAHVVFAPAFDIVHLEVVELEIGDGHADMVQLATWKDVAADGRGRGRIPAAASKALEAFRAKRDRVMKIKPARLQQAIDGLKIGRMVGDSDML